MDHCGPSRDNGNRTPPVNSGVMLLIGCRPIGIIHVASFAWQIRVFFALENESECSESTLV